MNRIARPACAALIALAAVIALALPASAQQTWFSGSQWGCTFTVPQYMTTTWDMEVHSRPESPDFTAAWTTRRPRGRYEDAYDVTGWSRDINSTTCDGHTIPHEGHAPALLLPYLNGARVSANFSAHGTRAARVGFDLWFTANTREHDATAMQSDPRTWEVLVQGGCSGWRDNPGWHRVYVGLCGSSSRVAWWGLNLTAIARRAGVPGWYKWAAVGAGGETPSGQFEVTDYYLAVRGQHPVIVK